MKKLLPLLIFIFAAKIISAQTLPPPPPPPYVPTGGDSSTVFTYAEVMPQFPGPGTFNQYMATHIKYPEIEREAGKQGTVYIKFVVEKDGAITNVHAVKEVAGAPGFTKEAMRVVAGMPNWKPGMMNGHPVRVEFTQPVKFVLDYGPPVTSAVINPSYPGGNTALTAYLQKNMKYPSKEKKNHKEGTVTIRFDVDVDGSLKNITVLTEVPDAPGLTKEALRLVRSMPQWVPGTTNGLPSMMTTQVDVVFKL